MDNYQRNKMRKTKATQVQTKYRVINEEIAVGKERFVRSLTRLFVYIGPFCLPLLNYTRVHRKST